MNKKRSKVFFLSVLSLFLLGIALTPSAGHGGDETGPATVDGNRRVNLWPFFYYAEDKNEDTVTVSLFTPLFFYHRAGEKTIEYGFRPLFSVHKNLEEKSSVVDFLYPIGKYKRRGDYTNLRIFPIIRDATFDLADGKTRVAHDYFPLFWGKSEDGESYFGIFPVYGTIVDRFGKDELSFLFWPIYSQTVKEGFETNNYLWPIFSRTTGDGGWGIKVFPLYQHKELTGVEYRTSYLFPLITLRGKDLDTDTPLTEKIFIPFYSVQETPHSRSVSYLWPFFTYSWDERVNYVKYDIPWPVFSFARSDILNYTQYFIFYRHQVRTERDSTELRRYILYPVFTEYHYTSPNRTEDTYRFFLIDKYHRASTAEGENELWVYVFPFYNRRLLTTGEDTSTILYPLPLYDDGFVRNLLPIFELYHREQTTAGDETICILHHLYIKETKDGVEYIDAPFFFREKRTQWHSGE
jgi:hypothetical protein